MAMTEPTIHMKTIVYQGYISKVCCTMIHIFLRQVTTCIDELLSCEITLYWDGDVWRTKDEEEYVPGEDPGT